MQVFWCLLVRHILSPVIVYSWLSGKLIGIPSIKLCHFNASQINFDAYLIIFKMGWLWYIVTCR